MKIDQNKIVRLNAMNDIDLTSAILSEGVYNSKEKRHGLKVLLDRSYSVGYGKAIRAFVPSRCETQDHSDPRLFAK